MTRGLGDVGSHCPTCLAEYRPGFDTCADCDVALVPGPAPEPLPEPVTAPEPPEHVGAWRAIGRLRPDEARLLAGRLRAEGIPARVDPEWEGSYYGGHTSWIRGGLDVLVPEPRMLEAQLLASEIASE